MDGKLGLGIYRWSDEREVLHHDAAKSGARLCLLYRDALPLARQIAERAPGMLIVGRPDIAEAEQPAFLEQPAEALRYYVRALVAAHPHIAAWAIVCEAVTGARPDSAEEKAEQYRRLAVQVRAELAMADELQMLGKGLVACNVGTGIVPMVEHADQADEWAHIIEPLALHPGCQYWGMHAYGTPDEACPGARGRLSVGDDARRYYALRHESFCEAMAARGVTLPPLLFTEYGQADGWNGLMSEAEAAADLLWFGERIQADPRVFGGCNFLHGDHDPARWHAFDTYNSGLYFTLLMFNDTARVAAAPPAPLPAAVRDLRAEYPTHFAEWDKAGGIEDNFRAHLLGIGALLPTRDDIGMLVDQAQAALSQIEGALDALT